MMKICTKCKQQKELSLFYKRKDGASGYTSHCKECKRSHDMAHSSKPEIKEARKAYLKSLRATPEFAEKERAYKYQYNRLDEVRERKAMQQRIRRLNPQVLAKDRQRDVEYAKNNPHIFAAKTRKRKASKLQRTPLWLSAEHKAQINKIYWEASELSKLVGEFYTVDHILPLQGKTVSGLHVPWNLHILSKSENSSKGNRL